MGSTSKDADDGFMDSTDFSQLEIVAHPECGDEESDEDEECP